MLTHELPPRDDRSDNFRHLAGMIVAVAKHYDIPHQQALAALRDFTPFAANYPSMRPEAVGGRLTRLW